MPIPLSLVVAFALAASPSSPARRGNDAILRTKGPLFSVAAAPRLGVLLAGGAQVISPVGFGAGLQFRIHSPPVAFLRFGGELQLGHTRFVQRRFVTDTDGSKVRRYAALGHTDFAAGPSIQLDLGPVFFQLGVGVGVGISTLVRPLGPTPADEIEADDTTAMLRGGGHLGILVRNNSSVIIGAAVHKYFSHKQVVADPDKNAPDALPDTNPFDLMLEFTIGYHFMF